MVRCNSVLRVCRGNVVVIQKKPLQQYFACCKVFIFEILHKKVLIFVEVQLYVNTVLKFCLFFHREKPASPKFIVTLDGANSDLEDKYDDQVKKEKQKKKRSKKKTEVDDFEEIDTSDVTEQVTSQAETTVPEKPFIKQITFDLDAGDDGK